MRWTTRRGKQEQDPAGPTPLDCSPAAAPASVRRRLGEASRLANRGEGSGRSPAWRAAAIPCSPLLLPPAPVLIASAVVVFTTRTGGGGPKPLTLSALLCSCLRTSSPVRL